MPHFVHGPSPLMSEADTLTSIPSSGRSCTSPSVSVSRTKTRPEIFQTLSTTLPPAGSEGWSLLLGISCCLIDFTSCSFVVEIGQPKRPLAALSQPLATSKRQASPPRNLAHHSCGTTVTSPVYSHLSFSAAPPPLAPRDRGADRGAVLNRRRPSRRQPCRSCRRHSPLGSDSATASRSIRRRTRRCTPPRGYGTSMRSSSSAVDGQRWLGSPSVDIGDWESSCRRAYA